ncbi:MAG: glycosyltransferase family 2 protein, partial [Gammaproteobacteria bacterium]|nr:glycosyltransferase family 2 protein [Gammaproteobacteria bacterium]
MNQENDIHRSKPTILRPKVAAAVVTYNHREAALTLLEFLEKNDIPTFITENAGTDGTREAIKKRFSKLSLLESSANLGGCGGFNCAVLAALSTGAEYIVLLDDDVLPESDCIPQLAEFLDSHEEYVFAAPAIYIASSPDTLQETGGGVDFSSGSPIEAWHRFSVNPELPPYLEVHYASACCLMVRAEVIRKTGVMDWNFFIFSDDVDWSLRLRKTFFNQSQSQNKGACVTTAKAVHDFPWAKPFSPMRLYFLQRNGLYLITRHRQSDSLVSLQAALMHLLWRTIYSKVIGDHEVSKTMWQAFSDAWHKRWGKWRQPVQFGVQRKKLDAEYFRKHKIRRVLLDITIENFDREALELIRAFGGKEIRVDVLCDMHRVDVYREKGMFHKVSGRFPGRLGPLKTFPFIARRRYDLVVTDAFMGSRRPTSMAGKRAAFYHAGELLLAANRPLRACLAYVIAPLLGIALSHLIYRRFLKAPALGIPPTDAAPLLEQIGIDPGAGQPWTRPWVQ